MTSVSAVPAVQKPDERSSEAVQQDAFTIHSAINATRNRAVSAVVNEFAEAIQRADEVFKPATDWVEYAKRAAEIAKDARILRSSGGDDVFDGPTATIFGETFLLPSEDKNAMANKIINQSTAGTFGAQAIMAFVATATVLLYRQRATGGDDSKPTLKMFKRALSKVPGAAEITSIGIADAIAWSTADYELDFDYASVSPEVVIGRGDDIATIVLRTLQAFITYIYEKGIVPIETGNFPAKKIRTFRAGLTVLVKANVENLVKGVMALLATVNYTNREEVFDHVIALEVIRTLATSVWHSVEAGTDRDQTIGVMKRAVVLIDVGIKNLEKHHVGTYPTALRMHTNEISRALAWAAPEWATGNAALVAERAYFTIYLQKARGLESVYKEYLNEDPRAAALLPKPDDVAFAFRAEVHCGLDRLFSSQQETLLPTFLQYFIYGTPDTVTLEDGTQKPTIRMNDYAVRGESKGAFIRRHRNMLGGEPMVPVPAPSHEAGVQAKLISVATQDSYAREYLAARKAEEEATTEDSGSDADTDSDVDADADATVADKLPIIDVEIYADDVPWLLKDEAREVKNAGFFPAGGPLSGSGRYQVRTSVVASMDKTVSVPVVSDPVSVFSTAATTYVLSLKTLVRIARGDGGSDFSVKYTGNGGDTAAIVAAGDVAFLSGFLTMLDTPPPLIEVDNHLRPVNGTPGLIPGRVHDRIMGLNYPENVLVYVEVHYWDQAVNETSAYPVLTTVNDLYHLTPMLVEGEKSQMEKDLASDAAGDEGSEEDEEEDQEEQQELSASSGDEEEEESSASSGDEEEEVEGAEGA